MTETTIVSEVSNVVGIITAPVALFFVVRLVNKIDRLAKEIRDIALYNAKTGVHCIDVHKEIADHLVLHDGQIKESSEAVADHEGRIVAIETQISKP